jgi:hypothetical protein
MKNYRKISELNKAVDEQLRGLLCPEDGLEKTIRGKKATYQQITGYRRRPENILVGMIKEVWPQKKK